MNNSMLMARIMSEDCGAPELRNPAPVKAPRRSWLTRLFKRG